MRATTGRFNLSSTARAWTDRSVNASNRTAGGPLQRPGEIMGAAPSIIRLFRILGDPVPEGPILFLNLYEIDKYILGTKP
jgi:hypothetical protein